jgi:hypothetical protein
MDRLRERLLKEYQGPYICTNLLDLILNEERGADLNGTHFETLDSPPSALEFMRIVNISRPVLFKGHYASLTSAWDWY